ncbi:MAG TPA: hypothetical protein VK465_08900 [Fibrobacteria bacterium]|nr:hypothetical protein [Fibrobacteria bacterium]
MTRLIRAKHIAMHAALLATSLACLAGLSGCLEGESEGEPTPAPREASFLFSLNSDRKSGTYSVLRLDSNIISRDIAAIHSDAAVRWLGGDDIFIINRLGRDNIQVIDRKNLKTVLQFSLPSTSNPYDLALKDSLLYVGFYNLAEIRIYHQKEGESRGSIDISAYADTSDGKPEVPDVEILGEYLYVLLANLDTKNGWIPLQSKLLRIRLADKRIESLDLPYGNALNVAYDSAAGRLYIPCRGAYFTSDKKHALDGGIVSVDLEKWAVADTLQTEASLGGTVNPVTLHEGRLYTAVTAAEETILSFAPTMGAATTTLATLEAYQFAGLAIDGEADILYVGDRMQGLRSFNLGANKENDSAKVSLGDLPIADLVLVK